MTDQDFANLEAWKQSQQKTIELIIGLLPPDQQKVQREQLQLMRELQKLPIEQQKSLIGKSVTTSLPQPAIPSTETSIPGSKISSLKDTLMRSGELSADFSKLKGELSFLENLQKLIESKNKPQEQIEELSKHYQQLQNMQKQPIAIAAQDNESSRVISRKETKENEDFVKEQMQKFSRGEPNFVAVRDTHYRIKPPHGKHCYMVCRKCAFISTTRHFKNHYRRHEIVTIDVSKEKEDESEGKDDQREEDK